MQLSGKIAVITGAGRGIGQEIARSFAREGADVTLAARTEDELKILAQEIRTFNKNALVIQTDVTIEEQVKNMINSTLDAYGQIDILVNNAGLGAYRPIYGTHEKNWNNMLAVNLTSTFFGTKHVWKTMRSQGGGSIINISSLSGTRAYPLYGAYSASKWGQIGFTKTAAEEGKPHNIRVNAIAPGKVDTAMRASIAEDKNQMLKAKDCVGPAIFLASEGSRYVTGQVIEIEWFGSDQ